MAADREDEPIGPARALSRIARRRAILFRSAATGFLAAGSGFPLPLLRLVGKRPVLELIEHCAPHLSAGHAARKPGVSAAGDGFRPPAGRCGPALTPGAERRQCHPAVTPKERRKGAGATGGVRHVTAKAKPSR
jgi:hypothetical protein